MRNHRLLTTTLLAAGLMLCVSNTLQGAAGPVVSGGGVVHVTDVDGNTFPLAGEFSVNGGLTQAGAPHGRINFVFSGYFAAYWGAVPDVTDRFRLSGRITNVTVNDGNIVLRGVLNETDYDAGAGVVFVEENVPFEIVVQPGSTTFVFQFCEVPPFTLEVATGTLAVHGG
jgi:hypothetical protein